MARPASGVDERAEENVEAFRVAAERRAPAVPAENFGAQLATGLFEQARRSGVGMVYGSALDIGHGAIHTLHREVLSPHVAVIYDLVLNQYRNPNAIDC